MRLQSRPIVRARLAESEAGLNEPCNIHVASSRACAGMWDVRGKHNQYSVHTWIQRSLDRYPRRTRSSEAAELTFVNASFMPGFAPDRSFASPPVGQWRACLEAAVHPGRVARPSFGEAHANTGAPSCHMHDLPRRKPTAFQRARCYLVSHPSHRGVSFHTSFFVGHKLQLPNRSVWFVMEPTRMHAPSPVVMEVVVPYVVTQPAWLTADDAWPSVTPWAARRLLLFASYISKTYISSVRFDLWKALRAHPLVTVRPTWKECAPGRCKPLYYGHNSSRLTPAAYLAESMSHKFCLVSPGDTSSTRKLVRRFARTFHGMVPTCPSFRCAHRNPRRHSPPPASQAESVAMAAKGGCLPAIFGGTAHLPYATQLRYDKLGVLMPPLGATPEQLERAIGQLGTVDARDAQARAAYAQSVRHAFVQHEHSSWTSPAGGEVAIAEACRIARGGQGANPLLFSDRPARRVHA